MPTVLHDAAVFDPSLRAGDVRDDVRSLECKGETERFRFESS
jgi:hypothetical protein